MSGTRRSFLALLAGLPVVGKVFPRLTLVETLNYGINPGWDGSVHTVFDDINRVTLEALADGLCTQVFEENPFFALMSFRSQFPGAPYAKFNCGRFKTRFNPERLPA